MVSIDNVYQKVLALANKEQRGYVTPQEFNLFADQAQMEILEQYFYDLPQYKQRVSDGSISELVQSKIEIFKSWTASITHGASLPNDVYRVNFCVLISTDGNSYPVEKMDRDEPNSFHATINNLPLLKPNERRPIYSIVQNKIIFDPSSGSYKINYIKKPTTPKWGYVVIGGKALYNSGESTDFELHPAEESELVYRILAFAGITLEKPQLVQTAAALEGAKQQQEKA
jgi:hypothetical protein